MDIITERLRKLREEKEMKQGVLAQELGISQAVISNYENGRNPPYDVLFRYMEYFDVSADYLLGFSENKKPRVTPLDDCVNKAGKIATVKGARSVVSVEMLHSLFELLRVYYRDGASAGHLPMDILYRFITSFSGALEASGAGDAIALLQAINDTVSSTFDMSGMLVGFLDDKERASEVVPSAD